MIARLRLQLEGIGWLLAWRIARWLPEAWVYRTFERLSTRSMRRNAKRRAAVETLLRPVVPADALGDEVEQAFRWYGRYWAETFRMADLTDAELDARFACEGRENIEKAFASGKGGVLATLHVGNWDAGGRWVASRTRGAYATVARRYRIPGRPNHKGVMHVPLKVITSCAEKG